MHHNKKTLVVSSSREKNLLQKSVLIKVSEMTNSKGKILWDNVAAEFPLDQSFLNNDLNKLKRVFIKKELDFNIVYFNSENERKKKLLIADMDGTIVDSETLDDLALMIGQETEITKITKLAMDGKINFIDSLIQRVELLKGTKLKFLEKIIKSISFQKGAKELISTMKKNNCICALSTGGFYNIAESVKSELGFDYVQANTLEIINNTITGELLYPILNEDSKLDFLNFLTKKHNLSLQQTCAIGDGANDIKMVTASSMGVSFKGKKTLKSRAKFILDHSDLTGLLFLQGFTKKEISK